MHTNTLFTATGLFKESILFGCSKIWNLPHLVSNEQKFFCFPQYCAIFVPPGVDTPAKYTCMILGYEVHILEIQTSNLDSEVIWEIRATHLVLRAFQSNYLVFSLLS